VGLFSDSRLAYFYVSRSSVKPDSLRVDPGIFLRLLDLKTTGKDRSYVSITNVLPQTTRNEQIMID
jgi:hypothetical protein